MTTNLTPAEALAMFKDWEDSALTIYDFRHKWYVSNDPDSFALIAIAALETLLSEHEAVRARMANALEELAQANMRLVSRPNVQAEPSAAKNDRRGISEEDWREHVSSQLARILSKKKAKEPAAAVPSGFPMTTNELDGRALAEAAARAMGWQDWHYGPPGWFDPNDGMRNYGEPCFAWCEPMLVWLRRRGDIELHIGPTAMQAWHHGAERNCRYGYGLEETLQRLVVAVAAREVEP